MKVVRTAAATSTEQSDEEDDLIITEGGDGVCEGLEVGGTSVGAVVATGSAKESYHCSNFNYIKVDDASIF